MKKILLTSDKKFYKANLHTHSTVSDGKLTPEELKKLYKSLGYSIVAYSDHCVFLPHNALTDDDFLALNSIEFDFNCSEHSHFDYGFTRSPHFCAIALDPENVTQPCWNENEIWSANAKQYAKNVKFNPNDPPFCRIPTNENISEAIRLYRDNGFFVTYNHPNWTLDNYSNYSNYHHIHAVEICNWASYLAGHNEFRNFSVYTDLLRLGKRIYCIAADDSHAKEHCGGGFTVINAEKLEYKTVTKALVDGNFYASTGPEIFNLWFEDGILRIECSDAKRIVLNTGVRQSFCVTAKDSEFINSAEFKLDPRMHYVTVCVEDENRLYAQTNAYFTDELFY